MSTEHPLKLWREAQSPKVSQETLGARLGVSGMTISRWEGGDIEPQKRQWDNIERVTGLTRRQFLGFAEAAA